MHARRHRWALAAGLACVALACGARSGLDLPYGPDGFTGDTVGSSRAGTDASVPTQGTSPRGLDCAEAGITYVYAFGTDRNLYSFYPTTGELTLVAPIQCETTATPFSMAVDHAGVAYVEYDDTTLFRVSTKTGACEPTPFAGGQQGFTSFGMGFVAGGADGGGGETLYIASDQTNLGTNGSSSLARIDLTTFELTVVGQIGITNVGLPVTAPELTGTGGGHLYAFFSPNNSAPPSYIVEIDTQTLQVESTVTLPSVFEGTGWAFGFWGGDFYTFTAPDGTTSVITRYRPSDQSIVVVGMAPFGVQLVGAGVSTCAPQQ